MCRLFLTTLCPPIRGGKAKHDLKLKVFESGLNHLITMLISVAKLVTWGGRRHQKENNVPLSLLNIELIFHFEIMSKLHETMQLDFDMIFFVSEFSTVMPFWVGMNFPLWRPGRILILGHWRASALPGRSHWLLSAVGIRPGPSPSR